MNRETHCSSCGAELSEDAAPQGLCAACLLKLGLSSANLIAEDPTPEPKREPVARHRRTALTIVGAGIVVVVLAWTALAFYRGSAGSPPATADVVRFSLLLDDPIDFAISPDGRRLAFTASDAEGKTTLWLRPMNTLSPIPLPETEGAAAPFWSPDSQSVGFFARGKLRKVDIRSGVSVTLCDAPTGKTGAWSAAGVIVFARATGGLLRVPAHGGTPEPATNLAERNGIDAADRWPYFLPDGLHFLYTTISRNKQEHGGIFVASLDNREARRLVDVRSPAAFASDALLFVRDGILQVQGFDPSTLEFRTDARSFPLAEQVDWFSLSQSGTLVFRNLKAKSASHLVWFDRTGNVFDRIEGFTGSGHFAISPDRRFVAVSRSGDIWISDLRRGVSSRLTFDPGEETSPLWSPRGDTVAFISNREGKKGIYRKMANGMNPEELLFEHPRLESIESWSPDDRFIVYTSVGQNGKSQNAILPITGDRKPILLQSAFNTRQGRFSPDGRWLTYVSDESGADEVYLETFPAGGGKWQVSVDGGTNPQWRSDGRELFYVSRQRNLMVAPIRAVPGSVELNAAVLLFRVPFETYDVAPDGRFLLQVPAENGPVAPIEVVINWTSDIQR